MSGRHVETVLPPRRAQRMGEECRYKPGPGKPASCPFGCDLGGNGRHRWSPVVDATPVPRHTVRWPAPDALAAMTRGGTR